MTSSEFRQSLHEFSEWIADYFEETGKYPVISNVKPGDIKNKLPLDPPFSGEPIEEIFRDFEQQILPGITHWQHPSFFAYFPASRSEPSVLAEMLTAALGAQCMVWYTSPAAEELEERMMDWIRDMMGLPQNFSGVIQDSASTATLVSLLTAREKATDFSINSHGFSGQERFRVYASTQAHSSVDKAIRISGIGYDNLIKIPVNENFEMDAGALEKSILRDLEAGYKPLAVVATFGTTSSTAIDPLAEIGRITQKYNIWYHVDAAFGGAALILPEYQQLAKGIEIADTIVFNPHKWLFTNFDCTVYLVKNKEVLINTFSIMPEYLKTPEDRMVNNYRDWGIPLGRRFRALKLWFVIRNYGLLGLQEKLRNHITWANWFAQQVLVSKDFELLAPLSFNLVCFRYHPGGTMKEEQLNEINKTLLTLLNQSGEIFLTHTSLNGKFTLRLVGGNSSVTEDSIKNAWNLISVTARNLNH
ncbi:MAG: aspartate aminotransferase family protein [Bacteroidales bacterium]